MSQSPHRSPPEEDAAVEAAIRAADHATAGWIVGVVVGLLLLLPGALLVFDDLRTPPTSVFYSPGPPWAGIGLLLGAALVAPVTLLLVRALDARIEARVRRMLREGTRCEGRIVLSRRVSMTQSRISVQGHGFPPLDTLVATPLPDAALLGRSVDVYVHPSDPHRPLVIPPPPG